MGCISLIFNSWLIRRKNLHNYGFGEDDKVLSWLFCPGSKRANVTEIFGAKTLKHEASYVALSPFCNEARFRFAAEFSDSLKNDSEFSTLSANNDWRSNIAIWGALD